MVVEKQTAKALLVVVDAVPFWIQRRWLKADGTLTPAGWKAFHIAKRKHWRQFDFDALKEFELVRETEKAVLLRCIVERPDGKETPAEFWVPRLMTVNYNFVSAKVKEIEERFPFAETRVRWRGTDTGKYPREKKGPAKSGGFPPSTSEGPGDFYISGGGNA